MIGRRALTAKEMEDLRRVAIHEAGHATVASHFGIGGEIRIQPLTHRAEEGVFHFTGCHLGRRSPSDEHARCLYGLAGVAAEAVEGHWDSVAPVLMRAMMSQSDADLAGDFTERQVIETVGLLKWLWPEVEIRATTAMRPWLDGPLIPQDPHPGEMAPDQLSVLQLLESCRAYGELREEPQPMRDDGPKQR